MAKKNRLLYVVICCMFLSPSVACSERVKEPAVAGSFYPADEKNLRETVDQLLSGVKDNPVKGELIALIAPHAGYIYSGQVAAHAYSHLKERNIKTVILIGASHYSAYQGASVYAEGRMKTPLGIIKINEKVAKTLLSDKAKITFSAEVFEKEHSLEVQLPFLQRTLSDFSVVPILMGSPTKESFDFLSERLTAALRSDPNAIVIASTDLSHYFDYETAMKKDSKIIDAVQRMAVEDAEQMLRTKEGEMCGGYPVLLTMVVARNLGATNGHLYNRANSGDVTKDRGRVVGYASMGFYRTPLDADEKKEIVALARKTIVQYVRKGNTPEFKPQNVRFLANSATFVTIKRKGILRGCIGNIMPVIPLYRSIISNAVSAATRDQRFRPMTEAELSDMEVEVTILSPLQPIDKIEDIKIGIHGLYITNGSRTGILLPQVAVEQQMDVNAFLESVSQKAGLPKDAWKSSKLYIFTADIIAEGQI